MVLDSICNLVRPLAGFGFALSLCSPAAASDGAWLKSQMERARNGAVIEVPAGYYDLKDVKVEKSLTLTGPAVAEGAPDTARAIFYSAEVTDKGLLVPLTGVALKVENITFRDVTGWSRNGAGIRHEGGDLTVINCVFDNNENGILSTGEPTGIITIANSDFIDNGFGDGLSHGIYVLEAVSLTVRDSRFVGTRIGHHVKSLAGQTTVTNTVLDDARGRTSYAIDASKGGSLTVTGNTMVQSVDSDNHAIINYDLTRGGSPGPILIENNTITNHYDGGVFLRNDSRSKPVMSGNNVTNTGRGKLKM